MSVLEGNSTELEPEPSRVERVAVQPLPTRVKRQPHRIEVVSGAGGEAAHWDSGPLYSVGARGQPAAAESEPSTLATVVGVFAALGYALSARALLLLALVGGFVLSVMAMNAQTQATLFVLVAYALLIVLPIVALEIRRRSA